MRERRAAADPVRRAGTSTARFAAALRAAAFLAVPVSAIVVLAVPVSATPVSAAAGPAAAGPAAAGPAAAGPAAAGPAAAEITAGQLHGLVQRALSDPSALSQLRQVERVDGRSVDLGRALDGASGAGLRARLLALDPGPSASVPGAADGSDPRAEASRILAARRFHPGAVPRPFRGLFRTLGRWLRPVAEPVGRAWSDLFGNPLAVGVLGAGVMGLAAVVSVRMVRRRSSAGVERARRVSVPGSGDDPDALERRAADAEQAGDLRLAVRLRFRAGLVRLDRAGVVADRPALTTGALTRELPSPRLRDLAVAFDEVAYGGRPASADDVAAARAGWASVLDEVAR